MKQMHRSKTEMNLVFGFLISTFNFLIFCFVFMELMREPGRAEKNYSRELFRRKAGG
jgi:hypothetical protein